MGFLFNASSIPISPGMFPSIPFQGRSAAGLPAQGGNSLLLVPCSGASGNGLLPLLSSASLTSWAVSCWLADLISLLTESCALSSAVPQAEDGHSSSKVPMVTLTSSPTLSTRQLPRVLPGVESIPGRTASRCKFTQPMHFWELGLVWGFFFQQDYFNFVLKCVFKQLPVLMNHLPGEQAHPLFFPPSLPLDGNESRNVLAPSQEFSEV